MAKNSYLSLLDTEALRRYTSNGVKGPINAIWLRNCFSADGREKVMLLAGRAEKVGREHLDAMIALADYNESKRGVIESHIKDAGEGLKEWRWKHPHFWDKLEFLAGAYLVGQSMNRIEKKRPFDFDEVEDKSTVIRRMLRDLVIEARKDSSEMVDVLIECIVKEAMK